ncbi:glycosyltransferase family 9 protein [Pseudobdellovibrio exovorus]|uniref:Uncharacterized protein n=1 Tax=Pseudobdellovibrio exovorus JSS TaxID=1184267 RepID=M4V8F0_9BACT|nr:glycosyltransferase family 9 protein [Pseudobdellovibrio exovorus]AGH95672.1 hypothetical protein A11Q_1456 [Pseudobdellovibrio exovorus JSS]
MTLNQRIRHWNHKRIDKMRAWKLQMARFVFGPFSRFLTEDKADKKILVLRLDGKVGDSVTATGFLRAIKNSYPDYQLIVATNKGAAEIYQSLSFIDQVLIGQKGIGSTLALFAQLKRNSYAYIVNTSHILTPQVIFLNSFLKAFRKISFENLKMKGIFSDCLSIDFHAEHITDRYQKVLTAMKLSKADLSYQVNIELESARKAEAYLQDLRKKYRQIIVLNSFAGARLRNFNLQTTKKIVSELLQRWPEACVLSVANIGDHRILNEWISEAPDSRWIHNPEFSTLQENMAILNKADILITPDTAWVHVASALKKKVVAVYREERNPAESNAVIWGPFGTQAVVVTAASKESAPDDINNVNVSEVIKAVSSIIDRPL